MTDKGRRAAAFSLRTRLDAGVERKQAFYEVILEVRATNRRCSRARLYAWCAKFGVSTR